MKRKHLLGIGDLSDAEIQEICTASLGTENTPVTTPEQKRSAVGLLFLEPSTRTKLSFERAAQVLGRPTVSLDSTTSSLTKGESWEDTLLNLRALGVETFVIRTGAQGSLESLRRLQQISILNAGDGMGEHPSQALLDLTTLLQERTRGDWKALRGLRIAILGDLQHSRVARSWAALAPRVGMELLWVSPAEWRPQGWGESFAWSDDKLTAFARADGVMALRIQKERLEGERRDFSDFVRRFQVRADDLGSRFLLHPGPVNWGVELDPLLQHDARSLVLKQVERGWFLRTQLLARY